MVEHYLYCYRTLGVEPGCTWTELKLAYRRLVRRWHPDQRAHALDETGDEQIKAVNAAFEALSDYYTRHGELPLLAPDTAKGSSRVCPQPTADATEAVRNGQRAPRTPVTQWKSGARFVLVGASLAVAYALVVNLLDDKETMPENSLYADRNEVVTTRQPEPSMPRSRRVQEPPQTNAIFFMPGSTIGEVVAAQGPPTQIEGNAWHYGKSRVYFRDGRVTHWDAHDANPLNARLIATAPAPSRVTDFGMGSTKPEVRAAQGRPLFETDTMWDYGASRVFFKDGRVSGWEESPTRPLHLRR